MLVFALLSVVFSVGVSAEDIKIEDTMVTFTTYVFKNNGAPDVQIFTAYINDDMVQKTKYEYTDALIAKQKMLNIEHMIVVEYENGEPMLKKDRKAKITLHNVFLSIYISNTDNKYSKYDREIESVRMLVHYVDGQKEYIDDIIIDNLGNGTFNFTSEFVPDNDVAKVEYIVDNTHTLSTTFNTNSKVELYVGEVDSPNLALSLSIQSEEAGLLTRVVEWLKSIKEGISSLFNSIKELPSVLWNYISNGLQNLFIPKEEFIVTFKEDMQTMLSTKLGAVYEVLDITQNCFEDIRTFDQQNTIALPLFEYDFGDGAVFRFGGIDVKIVPEGFEFLAEMCKMIVGIVSTLALVNGLRRRYDEVIRGEG